MRHDPAADAALIERVRSDGWSERALGDAVLHRDDALDGRLDPRDGAPSEPGDHAAKLVTRLEAQQSDGEPFSLHGFGRTTGDERLRLVARATGSGGSRFTVETKVTDATRAGTRIADRWIRDDPFRAGPNTITSTLLTADAFDDRVRLESAVAFSQFLEAADGSTDLEGFDAPFAPSTDTEEGLATRQSLEVDLLRGPTRMSAFTRASSADRGFENDGLSKRERRFGKPGEDRFSYGATVGWRPLDVTVAFKQRSRTDLHADWRERSVSASASVSTQELARLVGAAAPNAASSKWMPASVWGSYEGGSVDPSPDATGTDVFDSVALGLTWSLGSFYATWGYWNYEYDGRQPVAGGDWVGDGFYVSGGYGAARWRADVWAGWNGSKDRERYARAASSNLDGGLRLSYTPAGLPDLDVSVSAGQYVEDYLTYGYEAGATLHQFGVELDFAKFVPALKDRSAGLSAFYWTENVGYSDTLREDTIDTEHVIGVRYTRPLQ